MIINRYADTKGREREGGGKERKKKKKKHAANNIISWVKKRGGQGLPVSGSARGIYP